MTIKKLCLYHRNCIDGYFAAGVVGQYFGADNVEFAAMQYGEPVPDLIGRDVYIVDFSFKPDELLPTLKTAGNVIMFDHHKSAIKHWDGAELPDNLLFVKDIDKSGVGIVWQYFYPNVTLPPLLAHVQDHDLWQFNLPGTREIVSALYSRGFIQNEKFACLQPTELSPIDELIKEGRAVARGNLTIIKELIKRNMCIGLFCGYTVPVANIPHEHASIAGELLSKGQPFAVLYEDRLSLGVRKFSLRSTVGEGVDVEEIARSMGGGGHKNAASFTVSLSANLGTYIKILNKGC